MLEIALAPLRYSVITNMWSYLLIYCRMLSLYTRSVRQRSSLQYGQPCKLIDCRRKIVSLQHFSVSFVIPVIQ